MASGRAIPYLAQRCEQRGLVAVACDKDGTNVVTLHRGDGTGELARLAVPADRAFPPITSVSFHPDRTVLAIGLGAYDGNWSFPGDLLFWNWEEGRSWRPFERVPAVIDARFDADGDRLHLLVRPWDEDVEDGDEWASTPAETIAYRAVAHFPGVQPPARFQLQLPWRLREADDAWLRTFQVARDAARDALAAWACAADGRCDEE